jgi:hypothetical protein
MESGSYVLVADMESGSLTWRLLMCLMEFFYILFTDMGSQTQSDFYILLADLESRPSVADEPIYCQIGVSESSVAEDGVSVSGSSVAEDKVGVSESSVAEDRVRVVSVLAQKLEDYALNFVIIILLLQLLLMLFVMICMYLER